MSVIRFNAAKISSSGLIPIVFNNVEAMNEYINTHELIRNGQIFFNIGNDAAAGAESHSGVSPDAEFPSAYWWSTELNQAVKIDCDLSNYATKEWTEQRISKYLNEDADNINNKQIHNTNILADDSLKTSTNEQITFDSSGGSVALIKNSILTYNNYQYILPAGSNLDVILTANSSATITNKFYSNPIINGDFIHSEVVRELNPDFDPKLPDPNVPEYLEVEREFNNQLPAGSGRLALESHIPNISGLATKDALNTVREAANATNEAFEKFKQIAATASDIANVINTARATYETIKNVNNMKDAIISQAKSAAVAAVAGAGTSLLMDALTDTVFTGTPQNIYRKYIWIHDKEVFDDSWTTFASSDETFKIRWEYQDKFKVPLLGDLPIIGNLFEWTYEKRAGYYEFPAHGKGGTTKIAGENWVYNMLSNYTPVQQFNQLKNSLQNYATKTETNASITQISERLDKLEGIISLMLDFLDANNANGIKNYVSTHSPNPNSNITIGTNYTTDTKFNKLLDYLENWVICGNINMSDIKNNVLN